MAELNFELDKKPKSRRKLYIVLTIIVLALAAWFFWNKYKNVLIDKAIEKAADDKTVVDSKIIDKKAEIEATATQFTEKQNSLKDKAIEIQKTTRYETPIIEAADYDAMRDSLSVAQPD